MLKLINILFLTLIPSFAFAADTTKSAESGLMSFIPLILVFIIFYFLLIRPQQKKAKEHQIMLGQLKIGNNVYTASGIVGKIKKINNEENLISLEVSENVVITVLKTSINKVLDGSRTLKAEKATISKSTNTKKLKN